MLHFVTSYMKQNKSRKQTLESAQYGLEISFKHPCDNTQMMLSSGIVLKLVRCFSGLLRVLPASYQSIRRVLSGFNKMRIPVNVWVQIRRKKLRTTDTVFKHNTNCQFFRCFVFSDAEAKTS